MIAESRWAAMTTALVLLGGAWFIAFGWGWRLSALYVTGGVLGVALYHALFGFTTASVFTDTTSVMNFGIVLGALLAAGLAGRFSPTLYLPMRSVAAAIIGGLLLGYGARLAFGCNIGAFFSGVASSSLHGWLWFVAALAGNWFGLRLRPVFWL